MLEKRQIPASVVKDMLDGVSEEEERERAEEFARKEVPKLLKKYQTEPRKGKAALSRKLASRGFTGVCLYAALAVYDEMEEEIPNKGRGRILLNRDPSFFCYKKEKGPETPFD